MNAGNLDIRLTADTATLLRAMDVAQSAVATVGTSAVAAAQRAAVFIASLERQATTAGMSSDAMLAYQAAQMGVTTQAAPMIARIAEANTALAAQKVAAQAAAAAAAELANQEERAAAKAQAFITQLRFQADTLGMNKTQMLAFQAAQMGVTNQAAPFLAKLAAADQQLGKTGISAGQTAEAMRMLPAQMTDIVTQLAGGQNPFLILIQQGGQIKDSFGGIKPAISALAGAITPVIAVVGLAATAIGGLALGVAHFEAAQRELATLNMQLASTGRAALLSTPQLKGLITEMARMPGISRDSAGASLEAFAKTHQIGDQLFQDLSRSVADYAAATGTKAPAAAKALADAFADPVKGAKALDDQFGMLTGVQQASIEEFMKHGQIVDAQKVLLESLQATVGGLATQGLTPLQLATEQLGVAWGDTMLKFSETDSIRSVDTLLVNIVNSLSWFIGNAPKAGNALSGMLNAIPVVGMLGLAGGASKPAGNGQFGSGATGSWAPPVKEQDTIKAGLAAVGSTTSQAGAIDDLRARAALAKTALDTLNASILSGATDATEAKPAIDKLKDGIAGFNEQIAKKGAKPFNDAINATVDALKRQAQVEAVTSQASIAQLQARQQLGQISDRAAIEGTSAIQIAQLTSNRELLQAELDAASKKKDSLKQQADIVGQMAVVDAKIDAAKQDRTIKLTELDKKRSDAITAVKLAELAEGEAAAQANTNDNIAAWNTTINAVNAYGKGIDDANASVQFELGLMGQGETARAIALAQYQSEYKLKQQILAVNLSILSADDKAKAIALLTADQAREAAAIPNKVYLDQWKSTTDQMNSSLTDALLRGFEDGKDFAKNFRDTLKNMFGTLVLRPIISAVLSPISGLTTALVGSVGGSGAAGTGLLGGVSNALGLGNTANNAYTGQGLAGTVADYLGLSGAAAGSSSLATLSGGYSLATGSGVASLVPAASTAGTLAGGSAFSLAGSASTAGTLAEGTAGAASLASGSAGAAAGGASGLAAAGPYAAAAVAIYLALKSGSWKNTNSGFNLGVSGADLGTQGFDISKKSGGLLGSDKEKTDYYASTDPQNMLLQTMFAGSKQALATGLAGVGIDFSSKITGFVDTAFNVGLKDLTPDQQAATLAKYFSDVQERMAQYVLGDQNGLFGKLGETAVQTIARLSGALVDVNPLLTQLGMKVHDLSLAGGSAASAFEDALGGLDNATSVLSAYRNTFFSQAERNALDTQGLTTAFGQLGYALPKSDAELRKWIETVDDTIPAGATLQANLINLSSAFDALTTATADAAKKSVSDADDMLQRAVDAQKAQQDSIFDAANTALQAVMDAATDRVSKIQALTDRLKSAQNDFQTATAGGMSRDEASAQLAAAIAIAQAGGPLPAADSLDAALTVISQTNSNQAKNYVQQLRAFDKQAAQVKVLSDLSGGQLTAQQQALKAAQDQLALLKANHDAEGKALDDMLAQAKDQVDAINGVNISVLSVRDALAAFNVAIGVAGGKPVGPTSGAGSAAGGGLSQADIDAVQGRNQDLSSIYGAYASSLGRNPSADEAAFWDAQMASQGGTMTAAQVAAAIAGSPEAALHGSHAGGLPFVPFDGYRAELHFGERVLTARENTTYSRPTWSGGGASQGGGDVSGAVQDLRASVEAADANRRAEAIAIAANTAEIARLTRKIDAIGVLERPAPVTA